MLWNWLCVFWGSAAHATTLLEASEGRLGYRDGLQSGYEERFPQVIKACSTYGIEQVDWSACYSKWVSLSELEPSNPEISIWLVVSALRAQKTAEAFQHFEPLLQILIAGPDQTEPPQLTFENREPGVPQSQMLVSDESILKWEIVLLEAWLLEEQGLLKHARKLLKGIPDNHPDTAGVEIVLSDILLREGKFRKRAKLWNAFAETGDISAWNWWHRALNEADSSKKEMYFRQAIMSPNVSERHYLSYIAYLKENGDMEAAFDCVLQGLSRLPDSLTLFSTGVVLVSKIVQNKNEQPSFIEQLEFRFPEHSKVRLIIAGQALLFQDRERAHQALGEAYRLGDRSLLYFSLALKDSRSIGDEAFRQMAQEAQRYFPAERLPL